ncbi:hypothetical protein PKF05_08415, partial [Fusobacterium simiae]|nr:hypothetical protein [Fusobacterium simiae]
TYILYELMNIWLKFNQYPFYYFYYFLTGFEIFLIVLMIFTPMRRSIKKSNARRRKERQRAKIEAELMEQIKIKEDLERLEALKIQKHKKMKEDAIKKKADNFEKMKKYKKTSRKKSNEKPLGEEIQNRMGKVVLQKTVTIEED